MQKMDKPKIDEQAVKIAKNLMAKLKSGNIISNEYFDGYHKAICDFILNSQSQNLSSSSPP